MAILSSDEHGCSGCSLRRCHPSFVHICPSFAKFMRHGAKPKLSCHGQGSVLNAVRLALIHIRPVCEKNLDDIGEALPRGGHQWKFSWKWINQIREITSCPWNYSNHLKSANQLNIRWSLNFWILANHPPHPSPVCEVLRTLAMCWHSNCTRSVLPVWAAKCKGVVPWGMVPLIWAKACKRHCTMGIWICCTAAIRGVIGVIPSWMLQKSWEIMDVTEYPGINSLMLDDVGWCWMMLDDVGWCWMMLDDVGWCWMMLDDVGWCWMMLDDVGWCWMMLDDVGWCWMVLDEVGWCWMMLDDVG